MIYGYWYGHPNFPDGSWGHTATVIVERRMHGWTEVETVTGNSHALEGPPYMKGD